LKSSAHRVTLRRLGQEERDAMAQEMVLTVIARDRPGLIKALSETIDSHAGNWIDSSMARLGGEFAGIVRIAVPDENASALEGALGALGDAGIWVTIRRGESVGVRSDEPARHISIDELNSRIFIGSMSGEAMFEATADIVLPADCDLAKLRSTIEGLANDLMVDVELHSLDSNDALD